MGQTLTAMFMRADQFAALLQERDELRAQIIALQSSRYFMEQTAELRAFQQRYHFNTAVLSQIIMKHFSQEQHFCFIDKGAKHGICPDMVALYKNCLVGKVDEVFTTFSRITFITDKSCKIAAFCAQSGSKGIYQGVNSSQAAALTFINQLDTLYEGDLILSSGQGAIFPRGFGLARITSFKPEGLYYTVQASPLLDLTALDFCYVVARE
jgi:rod shape-determining protein MreC